MDLCRIQCLDQSLRRRAENAWHRQHANGRHPHGQPAGGARGAVRHDQARRGGGDVQSAAARRGFGAQHHSECTEDFDRRHGVSRGDAVPARVGRAGSLPADAYRSGPLPRRLRGFRDRRRHGRRHRPGANRRRDARTSLFPHLHLRHHRATQGLGDDALPLVPLDGRARPAEPAPEARRRAVLCAAALSQQCADGEPGRGARRGRLSRAGPQVQRLTLLGADTAPPGHGVLLHR